MVEVSDEKTSMETKHNNDPWVPVPEVESHSSQLSIVAAPQNPLNKMIDSERYIQSLERKLANLTKGRKQEPSSRDIITSLALFNEDQMRRYISETDMVRFSFANCSTSDAPLPQASFVQRKLYPEKQPLNAEEITELVNEDVLSKVFEEIVSDLDNISLQGTHNSVIPKSSESTVVLGCTIITDDQGEQNNQGSNPNGTSESADEDWANFDELNNDIHNVNTSDS